MKKLRVYADASAIGGCIDPEFTRESSALLRMVREGGIVLLLSDVLAEELIGAPPQVRRALRRLPVANTERLTTTDESRRLRDAYLDARVVGHRHERDAHHIAIATVARADLLVSWNFRHIVHWDKIRLFNAVNLREGYLLSRFARHGSWFHEEGRCRLRQSQRRNPSRLGPRVPRPL